MIDAPQGRQRRAAAARRAWRRSGARSCRPAARSRRRRGSPTSARPAPSASSPRSATSARRSSRLPCANADEVFHATSAGAADFGVVPVENSSEGVVTRSLDLFLTTPLTIVGETSLYVRHNLLRKVDSLDGIVAVCAHPQALAQCHAWLSHHLPNAERRPVASNAEGARLAGLDPALAGAGERARGERIRPLHRRPGDPGRRPQPHPLRGRRPSRHAIRSRRPRATTAPASSSRWPTGRARCTTCCGR